MANSSAVYVRMDPTVKEAAEEILAQLGITSSGAVQMLYKQIILHRGLPFSLTLPDDRPVAVGGMSRAQIDAELNKGMESLQNGRRYSADEVDNELAQEFGI
ncbi:MAG: type II toxin-antitoxin system RelB/DinJ family antitoxin [Oscillospiraceae bacterium]|nr:type II toxin-antitoxin system RelB/DinJ family antitoxin [Oscillospiraceae bacterium]